jgi:protein-tyrosine phosphatase
MRPMKTSPFVIDHPGPGRLAIMAHPASSARLAPDLANLRAGGVDTLVSALTSDECDKLAITQEPALAYQAGLSFVAFPILDRAVPEITALRDLANRLAVEVSVGRFVVAHCWGGVGRSSVIAGATLIRLGMSANDAMERISAARGLAAPETGPQRDLLRRLDSQSG